MVHFLSALRRDEFLSANGIVRIEMCLTDGAGKPTLYIKSGALDLYFVAKNCDLHLDFVVSGEHLIYVVAVNEGTDVPLLLYSRVESLSEKFALQQILSGAKFDVILFNDFAIEMARTTASSVAPIAEPKNFECYVPMGFDFQGVYLDEIATAVEKFAEDHPTKKSNLTLGTFTFQTTSHVVSGPGNMFEIKGFQDFTTVHECLPQIVGDHTLLNFVHSPYVSISEGNLRELCDNIIFHQHSILSLQAKCFDFTSDIPPTNRKNAEKRMIKNIRKALKQTKGTARMFREGKTIKANVNDLVPRNFTDQIFGIFVPDLNLISKELSDEFSILSRNLTKHGQRLIALDPMQLLRTLQASTGVALAQGRSPETVFFEMLRANSENASQSGHFGSPIIYRW